MSNEFIIKIVKDSTGKEVSLDNMPLEAADALKVFIESLSNFAKLHSKTTGVRFSIKSGSIASCLTYPEEDTRFDNDIDDILNGKSQEILKIKLLKDIQSKIKANGLEYSVLHKRKDKITDLTSVFKAKDFTPLKTERRKWFKDVIFIEGNLFEAGGKVNANIHVEDKTNFPYTIDCTKEVAKELNNFLYETVYLSVLRKFRENKKENEYEYELLDYYLKKETFINYQKFYEQIIKEEGLERYDLIHNKIVSIITDDKISNGELLKLLRLYNYKDSDRGIVRTILMTLKPVQKDEKLKMMYDDLARNFRAGSKNKFI